MDETESSSPRALRRWALAAGLTVLTIAVLIASHWPLLPWFLDYFYHLAVVKGFDVSGGLTLHDWWEFAPEGRPHLYPPLWHLVTLLFAKTGIPPVVLARLWCVVLFPLLAVIFWRVVRELHGTRAATLSLLLLATPFSLTVAILNYPTSSLACIFAWIAWLALERRRQLAASLTIAAVGYTHVGLFWLFALTLLLYALLRKEIRREILKSLLGGMLLTSPWLIHQIVHLTSVHLATRKEAVFLEISPALVALAGWGAFVGWRSPSPAGRFGLAWWLGTLPLLIHYRFRLLAGHGLLPSILLAGLGAADLWKRGRTWRIGLLAVLCLWPTWHRDLYGSNWRWFDHSLATLSGWQDNILRVTNQPMHFEKFWLPVAEMVRAHTQPDELFACNLDYVAGLMMVLSGRATTAGMLGEVQSSHRDPIAPARVVLWIKVPTQESRQDLEKAVADHGLALIGETEVALLYLHPKGEGRRRVTKTVLPWWLAGGLMLFSAGAVVWDLSCRSRCRWRRLPA